MQADSPLKRGESKDGQTEFKLSGPPLWTNCTITYYVADAEADAWESTFRHYLNDGIFNRVMEHVRDKRFRAEPFPNRRLKSNNLDFRVDRWYSDRYRLLRR